MCIHERQLLLKSFLFNYYFYFFADLSRFHCDIGCSLFLSGDLCCSYCCFLHSNGNDLFLAAGQCNGHFGFSGFQAFHRSLSVYRNDFLIAGSPAFNGITLCKSRNLYFRSRLFYFQLNAGSRYLDRRCQFFADGPLFLAALVAGTHLYRR